MEKTLQKKLRELNDLKTLLISRKNDDGIVESIKYVVEDIELALIDLGYIKNNDRVQEYTLEEVAKYNGQNGSEAWVVIEGNIYDASKVKEWANGMHFGVKAGQDVSQYFKTCHNSNKNFLDKLILVGKLKA